VKRQTFANKTKTLASNADIRVSFAPSRAEDFKRFKKVFRPKPHTAPEKDFCRKRRVGGEKMSILVVRR